MTALDQPQPQGHQEWDLLREQGHFDLYMGDALDGQEKTRIEDHLTSCAECRRYLNDLKTVDGFIADTMKGVSPFHLEERIQRSFLSSGAPRRRWAAYIPRAVAAGIFFIFLGIVVDASDNRLSQSPYSVVGMTQSRVDSVMFKAESARAVGLDEEARNGAVMALEDVSRLGLSVHDRAKTLTAIESGVNEVENYANEDAIGMREKKAQAIEHNGLWGPMGRREISEGKKDDKAMVLSKAEAAGEMAPPSPNEGRSPAPSSPAPLEGSRGRGAQFKSSGGGGRGGAQLEERAHESERLDARKMNQEVQGKSLKEVFAQTAPEPANAPEVPGAAPAQDPARQAEERGVKLIRNGELTYEVENYTTVFTRVGQLTGENGGYVASENAQKLSNGKTQGTLVIRVPAENFMALVGMLRGIGELKHQNIRVQDVTKSFFDTQSRIQSLDARRESLLKALEERKGDLEAYVKFEAKLAEVLEELEKLKGEMKYMENQVAFSTLTLTLIETGVDSASSVMLNERAQMQTAVPDVDKASEEARRRATELKATILSNRVNRGRGRLDTRANLMFEIPTSRFDELLKAVGELGRVTSMSRASDDQPQEGIRRRPGSQAVRKDGIGTLTLELYHLPDFTVEQDDMILHVGDALAVYKAISDMEKGGRLEIRRKEIDSFSQKDARNASFDIICGAEASSEILGAIRALGHVKEERGQPISALTPEGEPIPDFQRRVVELRLRVVKLESVKTRSLDAMLLANNVQEAWNEIRSKVSGSKDFKVVAMEIDDNSPKATQAHFRIDIPASAYESFRQFIDGESAGYIQSQKEWNLADKPGEIEKIPSFQEQRAEVALQIRKLLPLTVRSEEMGVKVDEVEACVTGLRSLVRSIEGAKLLKNEHNHDAKTAEIEAEIPEPAFEKALADLKGQVTGKVYHKRSWTLEENPEDPAPSFQKKVGVVRLSLGELTPITVKTCELRVYEDSPDSLRVQAEETGRKGGRVIDSNLRTGEDGSRTATVVIEVPVSAYDAMLAEVKDLDSDVLNTAEFMENLEDPKYKDEKLVGRIAYSITNSREGGVAPGGFWGYVSSTLRDMFRGLQIASRHLIVGLSYSSPFLLVGWWLWRRRKKG
ncbi:MAG: DUF4349 domain-containing protein [Planctomycetota bacterium]